MVFTFKRRALVGMVLGIGVVFAGSAYAGYSAPPTVYIDNTAHTAEGSFFGARNSANNVEYIGAYISDTSVSYYAVDASGTYRACGHPGSPTTTERFLVATISNQSWMKFAWDPASGYCVGYPQVQNISFITNP